jgi:hypothetical protein
VQHKGVEYRVMQTANPTGWTWIVFLDETRIRTGISISRAHAVLDAERVIDKTLTEVK